MNFLQLYIVTTLFSYVFTIFPCKIDIFIDFMLYYSHYTAYFSYAILLNNIESLTENSYEFKKRTS